ncbi:MAG: phosphomannomutase/phosphoglucomutase [Anaerofustis sp.]
MQTIDQLQNGSDIRGVALASKDSEPVNLTPEIAGRIAAAFVYWLKESKRIVSPRVCIGRDSRLSGEALSDGIVRGLRSQSAQVFDFGLASTPAMFVCTKPETLNADGAIMITASHLPFNRNGMKFFVKEGGLDKSEIKQILKFVEILQSNNYVDNSFRKLDYMSAYAESLVTYIREKTAETKPLSGFHILVDAGNGSGGFFVDKVLITLGADTSGSVYLDPDGRFPNHVPNPENVEIMRDFGKIVVKEKADLGIMFDTDVDRAALVDFDGTPIARNRLIALISENILFEYPGSTIVTDSVTSASLKRFIESRGGVHHRFQRGYNNVIKEAKRLNAAGVDCALAIETSGHCALRENDFLDDGAFLVIKLLILYTRLRKEGKTIAGVLSDYREAAESLELRPKFIREDFKGYGVKLLADFEQYVKKVPGWELELPNYEGVRVRCSKDAGDGWALMRLSLHDPELPINIESDAIGGAQIIKDKIIAFLSHYDVMLPE